MNKKTRITIALIFLAVIIFGVLAQQGLLPFVAVPELKSYECLGGGVNVYSLSRVEYVEYDSLIKDEVWKLSLNPSTGSQCLFGKFDKNDVSDEGKEGIYDFSIDVKTSPQVCEYDIQRTGRNIKKIELGWRDTWYPWRIDDIKRECESNAITLGNQKKAIVWESRDIFNALFGNLASLFPPYRCYYFSQSGTEEYNVGDIVFDKLSFATKILLNSPEGVYEGEITNTQATEGQSGKIPSGKQFWLGPRNEVRAEFEGMMSTGQECARIRDLYARAVYKDYRWKIIDEDRLDDYKNYDDSGMWSCIVNAKTEGYLKSCGNSYNNLAEKALMDKPLYYKDAQAEVVGSKIKFVYDELRISYPIIGLRVKADILGIATRGGEPEITDKSTKCFTEGYDGFLEFDVKNVGKSLGNFYSQTNCPSPIIVITQPNMKISVGSEKTFRVNIRSNPVDETTKVTCTFKVWDDETGKEDSASIEACVESAIAPCTIGDKRCSGDKRAIESCYRGGTWDILENCEENETCIENGAPRCLACIGEGETIISGFDCCPELIKKDDKCIKTYCENCLYWGWNKLQPGLCTPSKYVDVWYLPESVEKMFTQDAFCPILLIFYGIFFLLALVLGALLLKIISDMVRRKSK